MCNILFTQLIIILSFDLNLLSRWIPQLAYVRKLQEQLSTEFLYCNLIELDYLYG